MSQNAIDSQTKYCLARIRESQNPEAIQFRLEEFNRHLQNFPLSRILANKLKTQRTLLQLKNISKNNPKFLAICSEVLGRLGHSQPIQSSPGIRILSIDGGGMKAVIALEMLRYV